MSSLKIRRAIIADRSLSTHAQSERYEIKRAKELLKHTGAQDISSSGEASADYPAASKVGAH
jgi:hypothetical protein